MTGAGRAWALALAAALGATALSWPRVGLDGRSHTVLVAQAELHPALASDPLVQATLASPYTRFARTLGKGLAALERSAGLRVDDSSRVLLLLLWLGSGLAMFRLARTVSGSDAAGAVAALWLGIQSPLTPGAVPYGLSWLDRSLGMIPLLLAVEACLTGRRWRALLLVALATHLHANPAIHLWPWLFVEDLWEAWKEPRARRGALARLAAGAALALPLVLEAGRPPGAETDPAHARACLAGFGPYVNGRGIGATDLLLGALGAAWLASALWRARGWAARAPLGRAAALAAATLAVGTISGFADSSTSRFWGLVVKYQPWVALYLLELCGQLAIGRELGLALERGRPLAPAYAWTIAAAFARDIPARALALVLGFGLDGGRGERVARWAAWAAAAAAVLAAAFPDAALAAAREAGLRGGFLSLPSFSWDGAAGLLLALAAGAWLAQARPGAWAGAACAAALFAFSVAARPDAGEDRDLARLARAARELLPPDALVFHAPIHPPDCAVWMARSRTRMTPCIEDTDGPMLYFSAAPAMGRRLREGGYDPDAVTDFRSHMAENARTLERATPERVARLVRERGVTHALLPADKPWPGRPLAVEGRWALYAAEARP